jgi:hypothetical protein
LNGAHDPSLAADLDAIADLERLLVVQMAGCHHLVTAPQFIAIFNPSHRQSRRYAERNSFRAALRLLEPSQVTRQPLGEHAPKSRKSAVERTETELTTTGNQPRRAALHVDDLSIPNGDHLKALLASPVLSKPGRRTNDLVANLRGFSSDLNGSLVSFPATVKRSS